MSTAHLHPPNLPALAGTVTLVGAGPGDPELLTLKAARAIANASVLLVDDLVNEAVLAHAKPTARIVYVGKRGGCQSTPQALIDALMIEEAQKGEIVVRLKGGDPMIFGRAGEEMQALETAGIPYNIINGITSALAASASSHIPLTHRQYAHGVLLMTGHAAPQGHETNWTTLGKTITELDLTLVIYMGTHRANIIAQGLLNHCPPNTPVALIERASTPQEHQHLTTLSHMTQALATEQLRSPLIMVIGKVARFARQTHATEAKTHINTASNS